MEFHECHECQCQRHDCTRSVKCNAGDCGTSMYVVHLCRECYEHPEDCTAAMRAGVLY